MSTSTSLQPGAPARRAIELLEKLVAFDTTSAKTNIPLIEFVKGYLADHGISSQLIPTADGLKANLFATIGPAGVAGIGLSGHTDVVPVTGQAWDTDPFRLVEKNGRLYGRGACDMKGFLAAVLAVVPGYAKRKLKTPIHILFSYDEEVGCTGVRPMIAELGATLPKPRAIIVGEPTTMAVVDAHKGPVRWHIDVTGRPAHSSMAPLGVNAITYAGKLLGELALMEQELKTRPPNPRFDPPYTTLQVTRIEGGVATNIVPASAWLAWEVRALPGLDTQALERRLMTFVDTHCLPEMRAVAPEAGITMRRANEVPAFQATAGSESLALALKLAQSNETFAVSYGTEAGLFEEGGAPSIVCGPGDIAQAHTANEWIAVDEMVKCVEFLGRLGDWAEA